MFSVKSENKIRTNIDQIKIFYPLFLVILFSCNSSTQTTEVLSDIEVIKFDSKIIDSLKKVSDSSYQLLPETKGSFTKDIYVNKKDSTSASILISSDGYIFGFSKSKNDTQFFSADYFRNGQLKTKTPKGSGELHGFVRHYHEDGRVRSEGYFEKGFRRGIWKTYDEDGRLLSSEKF